MRSLVAIGTLAGMMTLGGVAHAQSVVRVPAEHDHLEIEVHGLLPYYYGFGIGGGARVGIPILASGFGHSLNNSFAISAGADAYYRFADYYGYTFFGIQFHVDAQWNVYLTPALSVFAEVGFAPELHFWNCGGGCGVGAYDAFNFWFDLALGVRFHFGGSTPNGFPALIARVGTTGITVGISF